MILSGQNLNFHTKFLQNESLISIDSNQINTCKQTIKLSF